MKMGKTLKYGRKAFAGCFSIEHTPTAFCSWLKDRGCARRHSAITRAQIIAIDFAFPSMISNSFIMLYKS
jgi:hypothetical protein